MGHELGRRNLKPAQSSLQGKCPPQVEGQGYTLLSGRVLCSVMGSVLSYKV
jgi:hypothetical protein